jgi:type IV secretory pathway VirB2 component (pilin)
MKHHLEQNNGARRISRIADAALRVIPTAALVAVGAYFTARQVLSPNQRAIKAALILAIMAFMFRFDMVYSLYVFVLLLPFPSGISFGSSNNVLMTIIPMVWAIRAASIKARLFAKTPLDWPHGVFLMSYVVSLINVDSHLSLLRGIQVIWRQTCCIAFFAMLVTFVNDEKKLMRLLQMACIAVGLVMLTAVVELVSPGATIIPGWLAIGKRVSEGGVSSRFAKMRVGGVLGSDANLADFGTQLLPFMVYFAWRSRNPAAKLFWTGVSVLTLIAVLSTGNRGGLVGIAIIFVYGLFLLRKRISFVSKTLIVTGALSLLTAADYVLSKYTYATSPIQRLLNTQMVGVVPETRTMTWWPSIKKSMEHPWVGSGPWFEIEKGLNFQFWPHNAYLFYLQTLGLFGLGAFTWIMFRVAKMSFLFRDRLPGRDNLADLMILAHIWLVVFAVEQLGIDHQRDDIYPYLVWLLFGVITILALLIRRREGAAERT